MAAMPLPPLSVLDLSPIVEGATAAHPVPAWLRYIGVGGVATLAHYALLWLLVEWADWPPPWAAGGLTPARGPGPRARS